MDIYENLANAIILQAVKDYRKALKVLRYNPGKSTALFTKKECEVFFRSAWYGMLTSVDGEMLISKLQKEVEKHEDF